MRDEVRENFPRLTPVTTRWMDNDAYGHVNNVTYYSYFDTAVNKYLIDGGALDIHADKIVGLVAETGCAYFRSIAFPDALEVGIRVSRIGTSSVRYEVAIFREGDERVCAAGHFVHVYVDRATGRPVAVPEQTRALLDALRWPR
ncbi:acyl-CoA thioesterase [Cupriavidus basilensis]|uniref:acyl-CoA thioesterase n=1 Tax=Cupriavidus basilensis TaxID=68895 RepID=UPI000750C78E|nr:thioesterase family protein [Cupriavidus basilensis]